MPKSATSAATFFVNGKSLGSRLRWWRGMRERAALRDVLLHGPHIVNDIGMTVADAEEAAGTPFWQYRDPSLRPY
jgi:uncharacterized protein YjiS (DUF1127 family)